MFPALSVTDWIVDVASFQPTITTFMSPATCAAGYVGATVWPLVGNALVCWTNAGVAAALSVVVIAIVATATVANATAAAKTRRFGTTRAPNVLMLPANPWT